MKLNIGMVIAIVLMLSLVGCQSEQSINYSMEFYISRAWAADKSIHVLDNEPTFTHKDIKSYDWKSHTIHFTEEFLNQLNSNKGEEDTDDNKNLSMHGARLLGGIYPDQFVILVDGEKILNGYFQPPLYVSYMPEGAVISDIEDGININFNKATNETEAFRNNDKLYALLKNRRLLK